MFLGAKVESDKKDKTNEKSVGKIYTPENVTDMTLEQVREKFKNWEHKVSGSRVEAPKQTESAAVIESTTTTKSSDDKQKDQVERLKSPERLEENVQTNIGKHLEEEEPSKKQRLSEDDDDEITKSANAAFTKIVNTITTPKDIQELHQHQEEDVKEVSDSAETAFTHVVDNVMKGKALSGDVGIGHHSHELKKLESPSIGNLHLQDANLQKLKSFKAQILSEVEKINKLQNQYGKGSKGAKDLNDARSVLQKDLNVVKELEGRLKNKKSKMVEQTVNEHDQRTLGGITESKEETIPDAKLGFTSHPSTKKSHSKFSKVKSSHKKPLHPLEEIHSLLKAEIKRLKLKKHGKPDPQLNNIRKLVQKRLKTFIKSGQIGKDEFKTLAPQIKELGNLLKHRISNAKKIKGHHKEEDLMAEAKQMEKQFGTETKGVNSQLNKAEKVLSNAPRPEDLVTAQSALEKLQTSNNSMVSSQSVKMKTLLTSLNTKLGQIFNKANSYQQQGTPQGYPQQPNAYSAPGQPSQMQQITGYHPGSPPLNIPNQFSPVSQHPQPPASPQAASHTAGLGMYHLSVPCLSSIH